MSKQASIEQQFAREIRGIPEIDGTLTQCNSSVMCGTRLK